MQNITPHQVFVNNIDVPAFFKSGIKVHENVSIKESEVGGTGLFFNSPEPVTDFEIVRIPPSMTFNLKNLMQRLEKLTTINYVEAEVVKKVLSKCKGINETDIIVDFIFSFMVVLSNKNHLEGCPVEEVNFYLELLSQTLVDTLDLNNTQKEFEDDFLFEVERRKKDQLYEKYQEIVAAIKDLGFIIPTFDEYYHISKVIKSRVLEIPRAVGDDSDDYTVDTTLVPLIDFVNHNENKNAYFDIDRSTNEVILKYLGPAGPAEVFISYSDESSVQEFVSTYGFIPQSTTEIFEVKLNKYEINECINHIQHTDDIRYDLILKWLEIPPTLQFIITKDKVGLNHNYNPIPLWIIFTEKFIYSDWKGKVSMAVVNDPDLLVQGSSNESIQHLIEFQEESCDVIQGVDKIAILPSQVSNDNEAEAMKKFNKFVKKICQKRHISKDLTGLTREYLEYKNSIYQRVLEQDDFEIENTNVASKWYQPIVIYNFL